MTAHDVRMQGFLRRHTVQQALDWLGGWVGVAVGRCSG